MKRLMVLAALAAGVALGALADGGEGAGGEATCPFAYRVKVMVRTTEAAKVGEVGEARCLRRKALKRYVGVVYGRCAATVGTDCGCRATARCGCNPWTEAWLALWDWDTRKAVKVGEAGIRVLGMVGTEGSGECEACMAVDGMSFGGYGATGERDGVRTLRSAEGYCSGTIPAGECVNCKECGDVEAAKGWSLCGGVSEVAETAAWGKWQMRWDESAVGKMEAGGDPSEPGGGWEKAEPVAMAVVQ